jgi:hypothetical protein
MEGVEPTAPRRVYIYSVVPATDTDVTPEESGNTGKNRTFNLWVWRPLLYQLSYGVKNAGSIRRIH